MPRAFVPQALATTAPVARRPVGLGRVDLAPLGNVDALLDHGLADLRRIALDVAATGLRAADPAKAVDRLVEIEGDRLTVSSRSFDLSGFRSVALIGAGKASMPIAMALERKLGARISRGLVVRRAGDGGRLDHVDVIDADHPVPSEASLQAGQRLLALADTCSSDDLVITAFTGGSSALACVPPVGVPFVAKQSLHALLVDSGASIGEVNAVRKHVSALKGGRLAARLGGATIINLTLSDVVGDAVDLLCDVVVPDTSTVDQAIGVLERYGLWAEVAPEIRAHLGTAEATSPVLDAADITTCMLVTGSIVVEEMAERVRELGWTPIVLGSALEGEAASLGSIVGTLAADSSAPGRPFPPGAVLVAAGGESTVSVRRGPGTVVGCGGPNQEAALGFARAVAGASPAIAGVFLDSDGSDGGTRAAGGCVDSGSVAHAEAIGVDVTAAMARHDSSAALEALGDLVLTGPTGTNISDLIVIAIDSAQATVSS